MERGGLAEELVGSMGLRPEPLVAAASLESEIKFDEVDIGILKIIEHVAVGEAVLLRNEGLKGRRGKHGG